MSYRRNNFIHMDNPKLEPIVINPSKRKHEEIRDVPELENSVEIKNENFDIPPPSLTKYDIYSENNDNLSVPYTSGFFGLTSITTKEQLSSLTGLEFPAFNYLTGKLAEAKTGTSKDLLLTLIKLKTGMENAAIATLFKTTPQDVEKIFTDITYSLCKLLKNIIYWQSKTQVLEKMPELFKKIYPNTRVLIDCIEIETDIPGGISDGISKEQILMYSENRHCHTVKFLVACHPNGHINFVSKCYSGRSSDEFIAEHSGFINKLESGDCVLVYKGFPTIQPDSVDHTAVFIRPPFYHNSKDPSAATSSIRIHMNRVIQRFTEFRILSKWPLYLLPNADNIVFVISALINLRI